ncbi:MAG TPA: hypothetical protein VFB41_01220 [Solirubrobacteraceae bacterium]|nr:hypothetical protein [Solirubrobacteraceae bacterium]
MDEQQNPSADQPQPTAEELRAYEEQLRAYEEQLARIRVEDVIVQTVVSLINLGARRAGLATSEAGPPNEAEVDLGQLRLAIEATRALMPLVEATIGANPEAAGELKQLRDAISQLQMTYASKAGPAPSTPNESPEQQPEGPGPAQSSGRLWVPGQ